MDAGSKVAAAWIYLGACVIVALAGSIAWMGYENWVRLQSVGGIPGTHAELPSAPATDSTAVTTGPSDADAEPQYDEELVQPVGSPQPDAPVISLVQHPRPADRGYRAIQEGKDNESESPDATAARADAHGAGIDHSGAVHHDPASDRGTAVAAREGDQEAEAVRHGSTQVSPSSRGVEAEGAIPEELIRLDCGQPLAHKETKVDPCISWRSDQARAAHDCLTSGGGGAMSATTPTPTLPPPRIVRISPYRCIVVAEGGLTYEQDHIVRAISQPFPCPTCWMEQGCHPEQWDGSRWLLVRYVSGETVSVSERWPE